MRDAAFTSESRVRDAALVFVHSVTGDPLPHVLLISQTLYCVARDAHASSIMSFLVAS